MAFAVLTPPQTTVASLTLMLSPDPVTVDRSALGGGVRSVDRVRGDLAGNHVVGEDLVSVALSVLRLSIVAGSILANAESIGAKTVNSPPLRVSDQVDVRVELAGDCRGQGGEQRLLDAAVATGSWAIPLTDPAPLGTAAA